MSIGVRLFALLPFLYVAAQATIDKEATLYVNVVAWVSLAIGVPLLIGGNVARVYSNRSGSVKDGVDGSDANRFEAKVSGFVRGSFAAIALGVFGYFFTKMLVPYVGGNSQANSALILSFESDRDRYRRNPIFIACNEYINLVIQDLGTQSVCLRRDGKRSRAQAVYPLSEGQTVTVIIRSNFLGVFVESIAGIPVASKG
jgi:hypothetical protein